jgi:hypothetical protein
MLRPLYAGGVNVASSLPGPMRRLPRRGASHPDAVEAEAEAAFLTPFSPVAASYYPFPLNRSLI